jgi:dTDP-3-amino-3,4,6-trideoxy-alpha-D-glucose transaminase
MIPVFDLQRQHQSIRNELEASFLSVMERGRFILDEEVAAFEQEFASYLGAAHAVAVGSGTEALHLALVACGVRPGDDVITVSHTAVATVAAIELTGSRVVPVDIDPVRHTLDPARLHDAMTPRTRAIVPVHLYGCPADLSPILEIARTHGLFVIEDCAQACGARYRGQRVGTWGHAAAFSFYPTKNLGACGDGGAVVTGNTSLAESVRMLRQYGWHERHVSVVKGYNTRLDELQAALLRVKLRHLESWNARRRYLARNYADALAGSGLALPFEPENCEHVYHLYVVRHSKRDALRSFLGARGIATMVHYPVPVHLQPAYRDLGCAPGLSEDEAASVCKAILDWFRSLP